MILHRTFPTGNARPLMETTGFCAPPASANTNMGMTDNSGIKTSPMTNECHKFLFATIVTPITLHPIFCFSCSLSPRRQDSCKMTDQSCRKSISSKACISDLPHRDYPPPADSATSPKVMPPSTSRRKSLITAANISGRSSWCRCDAFGMTARRASGKRS